MTICYCISWIDKAETIKGSGKTKYALENGKDLISIPCRFTSNLIELIKYVKKLKEGEKVEILRCGSREKSLEFSRI